MAAGRRPAKGALYQRSEAEHLLSPGLFSAGPINNSVAAFLVARLLLDELENIEALKGAIGEEAVHGFLLIGENLEHNTQFCQYGEIHARSHELQQNDFAFRTSTTYADQRIQAGAVDTPQPTAVYNDLSSARGDATLNFLPQFQILGPNGELAVQTQNQDAFTLVSID
jgi:hypothetical protein